MWAVIRVRGSVNISSGIRQTLELLRLEKPHNMVVIDEKTSTKNMVLKVKEFVTFGEIDEKTFAFLLNKRGRIAGNKRLTSEMLKEIKVHSVDDLAKQVFSGKKRLKEFGVKEVFRLNSPKKGFDRGGVKKAFSNGGVLGYRGKDINDLIEKMA